MSVQELKERVLALPEKERHDFVVWASRLEHDYGDVDPESVCQVVAEVWNEQERHARPDHSAQ